MTDIEKRSKKEQRRLNKILIDAEVSEKRRQILAPIVENVAYMKVRLDDAREAIKASNIVIAYDNGGGQRGVRENPLFTGYEKLWRSYVAGMDKILQALPPEAAVAAVPEVQETRTMLEIIKCKKGA